MPSEVRTRKKQSSRPFSLLIKPASADCNLQCSYCFYLAKSALYPGKSVHRMDDEVLEAVIRSYMNTRQEVYSFGWQGGEPSLPGTEFYRKVVELQKKYGRSGTKVANGLQTNATLIDDEFAAHLARYHFLVGVSLDGPEEIHNVYRKNAAGHGSYRDVVRGIETLRRNNVEYNGLVLVSSANVHEPGKVYSHLKELGIRFQQYIPCVEYDEKGSLLPWGITGSQWGAFLLGIWEQWYPKDMNTISVRNFDAVLQKLVKGKNVMCSMGRNCSEYFLVEHNGDVYPCDFFVERERLIGNIRTSSMEELRKTKEYRRFGRQKSEWASDCVHCPYLHLCGGDCLKHRYADGGGAHRKSVLCEGWKSFYTETLSGFEKTADQLKQGRVQQYSR